MPTAAGVTVATITTITAVTACPGCSELTHDLGVQRIAPASAASPSRGALTTSGTCTTSASDESHPTKRDRTARDRESKGAAANAACLAAASPAATAASRRAVVRRSRDKELEGATPTAASAPMPTDPACPRLESTPAQTHAEPAESRPARLPVLSIASIASWPHLPGCSCRAVSRSARGQPRLALQSG